MTKVKIEGFARIDPSTTHGAGGYRFRSLDISDETVELEPGDVIVSEGPISFEVIENK